MNQNKISKKCFLVLQDGSIYPGYSFGAERAVSGEVVFNTGMVGYEQALTDPSYSGQILIFTYPLIGNYGVAKNEFDKNKLSRYFESEKIHPFGLIVSEYCSRYSHFSASKSLSEFLIENHIPAIAGIDTRALTKKIRECGTMPGKIVFEENDALDFYDPDNDDLVKLVTSKKIIRYNSIGGKSKVVLIDCGVKHSIIKNLIKQNLEVIRVPYDYDFTKNIDYDAVFISNGPGDPMNCSRTIEILRKCLNGRKPVFGICLGNQLLALAVGAKTYKLKYGHRSQNQPCINTETKRCYITSQNHGFAIDDKTLPQDWKPWFFNANDGTNEGIKHKTKPFMSVQFHPEANPGPNDTQYLFAEFAKLINEGEK
ncbi:MAG: carbamoyl-phosphate synthase (glutamine-hydrolyzing) small subunit [Candidatus Nanohalarchaeota archaeon]|nr:MAG: carbamoyl-phosphate synthase (glutamine-hydrolyzing) small subunit [Candidatus Nanohaloarchaeota archaeon]